MRFLFLFLALTGALALSAGEVVLLTPELKLVGRRVRTKPAPAGVPGERVTELGYTASFILRNTGVNTVKLATGFNSITFLPEPGSNLFVLKLSHRLVSVKLPREKAPFPLILPRENFRIVTLLPGVGTLLSVSCWIPEEKLRSGDRFVIEYAPRNLRRYDFQEMKLRSLPMEFKFPQAAKKVSPVAI